MNWTSDILYIYHSNKAEMLLKSRTDISRDHMSFCPKLQLLFSRLKDYNKWLKRQSLLKQSSIITYLKFSKVLFPDFGQAIDKRSAVIKSTVIWIYLCVLMSLSIPQCDGRQVEYTRLFVCWHNCLKHSFLCLVLYGKPC